MFTAHPAHANSTPMHPLTRAAVAVVALWLAVAAAWALAKSLQPTPERFAAYLRENPLAGADANQRGEIIGRAAHMLNGLDFDQRQALRGDNVIRGFAEALTEAERSRFFELTMPGSVRQFAAEMNRMTPLERRRAVKRMRREMEGSRENPLDILSGDDVVPLMREGRENFLREANAQVRQDMLPLFDEAEKSMAVQR